jgi:anthranilate/para-aminobenzoate synthase component I
VGARELADLLWSDNPVPWAICVDTANESVVSNSPELFLDVCLGSRRVSSAPIKGTVPRLSGGPDEDARAALLGSEKDAAEHLMIVDLIRNDLGRVCEAGSVRVPEFRTVRSFRHLHHLESTVAGRLRREVRLSEVLRATLPGGSITGAPKRAALGFIRRLEPVARGPYTGAAGYVRGDGTAVFNVAIRTAHVSRGGVAYHAGGGVVWDSDPRREWEETETKSREFFSALASIARSGEVS